ncbi:MAG: EAL domain-containing protein [Burkholderiales bacterium]|nr:EAL domain-containing protein [Burkholderiales bacterium]
MRAWRQKLHGGVERSLHLLSVYAVPLVIGLLSIVALVAWESRYDARELDALPVAALEDPGSALDAAGARAKLEGRPRLRGVDTRLSEAPFWIRLDPPAGTANVEFPSRHALRLECWNATTLAPLGRADRGSAEGLVREVKAGFAVNTAALAGSAGLLCRGSFAGPARITATGWSAGQLAASAEEFHRNAGLLQGGLLVLAAFVLVTAAFNREWLYVLLAAWLVASLRLGALSAGWDTQWLGRAIPGEWMLPARKLTIAAYFVLTYVLFARLFRDDLKRLRLVWPLRLAQWSCVAILAAALVLPFASFLPVMWLTVAIGSSVIASYLLHLLFATRSIVALLYSASLGIVLLGGLSEVVAVALGVKNLLGILNSVTAALASCLMAALGIAEQMRQERIERLHAQTALRTTYEAIPIGLFTMGADGAFERVNPALAQMLGVDARGLARTFWRERFEAGSWDRLQDGLERGAGADLEIRGIAGRKWFHVKAARTASGIEGSLQDVTERVLATERLRYLAENDPLTGALNRRGVEKLIEAGAPQAADSRKLALAYLDLDRFKLINDMFGHVAGDDVLRQVCRRIEGLLSAGQVLGRIGGDEFIVVFGGTPIAAAAAICRGIVGAISESPFLTGDKAFQVKISIGLVEVAENLPVKDAIAVADRACRAAKTGPGEGLVVFSSDAKVFHERAEELRLVERIAGSNQPEGLFLVMQPILSLSKPYDSLNFEMLLRMRDRDGSVIPGGRVVAAAENNGRAAVIDRWVLAETLGWLETHHAALASTRFVTMNLSGASLNDERFVQDAFAMLAASPRATGRLCIEITEGVALHDLDNTRRFIDQVRGFGAKVALDDFGAGYTSFSYLKELPADALKIDGSFIVNMTSHPANIAIVEAIVELGRNLGMKSIAEWAEDRATVQALVQAGADYVQGFAVSAALAPEVVLAAHSTAALICNPEVAAYMREVAAAGGAGESFPGSRPGIH